MHNGENSAATAQSGHEAHAFEAAAGYQPLPRRALWAMRAGALATTLLLAGPLAFVVFMLTVARGELGFAAGTMLLLALALALFTSAWCVAGARWRCTSWRLDQDGLAIRRGVLWRSETLVPRSRLQHVDLAHGPIDRRFGLATVKVYTAGTRLASVSLSGLEQDRAEQLRDALVVEAADDGG